MIKRKYTYTFLAITLFLTGCASVQTVQEWNRVKAFTKDRTGAETRWEQTDKDVKDTQAEVNKLLSDGLTIEDTVRIALLNHRKLQATFEEIGVAKADLVQAGLFTNPNLSAVFRFPSGGGSSSIEGEGVLNIADFWQIPLRKKVATAKLEAAMLQVSEEILTTVAEAKQAYIDCIALMTIKNEMVRIKQETESWKDHLIYRQRFGFSTDLDINMAKASALEQELELAKIERNLKVARIRLDRILGLSPEQSGYEIIGSLSEEFRPLPDLETMIAHAFSMRPDVQIAKIRIEESKRVLALERKRIFTNVEAGVAYAKEVGKDELGPAVGIQLPIFDQNQAQIAKAEYNLRKAEKEFQVKTGLVRENVLTHLERVSLPRQEAAFIRNQILPARRATVEYAQKYFNAMQLNMLYLLEARRGLLETQRRLLEALREQDRQEIELERLLGGRIPEPQSEHKGH